MKNGCLHDRLIAMLRPGRRELDARRLRSMAWLDYALQNCNLSLDGFAREYVYQARTRSNLARKWFNGNAVATENSVRRIERHLPGSAFAYDHPLFTLLEDRAFSERQVRQLLAQYQIPQSDDFVIWKFPDDELVKNPCRGLTIFHLDTYSLVKRRDLWGFMAIVGMVRLVELSGDALHMELCRDMYRALPAALAVPWLRRNSELLKTCVDLIRRRVLYSWLMFDVDWEIIDTQSASIVAHARCDDSDGAASRMYEDSVWYEDPILPAYIVSGKQWFGLDEATKRLIEATRDGACTQVNVPVDSADDSGEP